MDPAAKTVRPMRKIGLRAEQVGQAAPDEQQTSEDHHVGVDDPLEFTRCGVQIPDERRKRHVEDGVVHVDDERGNTHHDQGGPATPKFSQPGGARLPLGSTGSPNPVQPKGPLGPRPKVIMATCLRGGRHGRSRDGESRHVSIDRRMTVREDVCMAEAGAKNLTSPDETLEFPGIEVQQVDLGDATVGHVVMEPGWRWSTHVRPHVGGDSCEARHVGVVVSGRFEVVMHPQKS